ncbi:MAG: hypothetical protein GYB65_07065 [Chloroflexi bacterium]|nr:hypothetical protein [Chloroflexota bacterium]
MRKQIMVLVACGCLLALSGVATARQDDPVGPATGQLVYLSEQTGNAEIFLYDFATGEETQLTDRPHMDWAPAWSPDGTQIAFHARSAETDDWGIWVMNADGSDLREVAISESLEMLPTWSPDGSQIAFVSTRGSVQGEFLNRDIYVVTLAPDPASEIVQRLTSDSAQDIAPDWSPDGSQIVFSSNRGGSYGLYVVAADAVVPAEAGADAEPDTTNQPEDAAPLDAATLLYDGADDDKSPAWSPDGTQLVYYSSSPEQLASGDVYIISVEGGAVVGDPVPFLVTPAAEMAPVWSPDGEWIAYFSDAAGNYDVYVKSADGTGDPIQVTSSPEWETVPDWRP